MCQEPAAISLPDGKNLEMYQKVKSLWDNRNTGIGALLQNTLESNDLQLPDVTFTFMDKNRMNFLSDISSTFSWLGLNIEAGSGAPLNQYQRMDTFTVRGPKDKLLLLVNYVRNREANHITTIDKQLDALPPLKPYYLAATLDNSQGTLERFCLPLKHALLLSHQCRVNEDDSNTSALLMKVKAKDDKVMEKTVRELASMGFKLNGWGAIKTSTKSDS